MPGIDVRRAGDRFHTRLDWLDSWHSFSFGPHHDPANVGHGLLLVHNDDVIFAGGGFGTHGHRDMEIVTWVLEGSLAHRDSTGTDDVIVPGLAQRMSAGSGIRHSEVNASATDDVHLVQMWVPPDDDHLSISPGYEQADVTAELASGALVTVASGRDDGAVHLHQRDASFHVARLTAGAGVLLPDAPHLHVFVAVGDGVLTGATAPDPVALATGDAARTTDAPGLTCTAGPTGAEVLVWATA